MTQREFINELHAGLTGKVSAGTVQENIHFYEQYFAEEIYKGRSEEMICASLGTPQLIVKGIVEAERFQSGGGESEERYRERMQNDTYYRGAGSERSQRVRGFRLPGWLLLVIAMMLFFCVISLVISVFSFLAPIMVPIFIVLFIVQIFKNHF